MRRGWVVQFGEKEAERWPHCSAIPRGDEAEREVQASAPWSPRTGHMGTAQSCTREGQTGCMEKVLYHEGGQTLAQI